jgi:menaquinone-dependent protoporphyrinogen IX oxidase
LKTVVVYKSKYGSTEKYGKWISEELQSDIFRVQDINVETIMKYENIVYCGGLYAGGILGFSIIKNNFEKLRDKNIFVVAVGATLKNENALEEVEEKNIPPEMRKSVKMFLLRGGLNYEKMNIADKFLMSMMVKSLRKKKPEDLDDDAKGILATYGKTIDFTKKDSIMPIIQSIKNSSPK